MSKNKLYITMLLACLAGIGYLFYSVYQPAENTVSFCMIKNVTGFPCPSCGTTRAVILMLQGKIKYSILMNPFGIILTAIMIIFPFWILGDLILKKDSFFRWYKKAETTLRKPWLAIILILLVILNWIWNIYKHL